MGMKTIGFDLTRWIAKGARLNLDGLSLDFESIIRADSTFAHFPLRRVDAVATDVPYGRASSTKGKDTSQIIREFTTAAAGELNSDKYCVLMHPSHVDLDCGSSFEVSEQHLLYVHRNLTRAISVLRRR
jgi:tRNA G10  N-methylase Trm11